VTQEGVVANRRPISDVVVGSVDWIRRLRADGAGWSVLPTPSAPELYPNNGNDEDGPWHRAKKEITEVLEDLTMLWQVGVAGRRKGHEAGVYRWTDPSLTPELVDVGGTYRPKLEQILAVNSTAWHYRVVDIKFRMLGLLGDGEL